MMERNALWVATTSMLLAGCALAGLDTASGDASTDRAGRTRVADASHDVTVDGVESGGACGKSPAFADNFSAAAAPGAGYVTSDGMWVRGVGTYTVTDPEGVAGSRSYALIEGDFSDFDVTIDGHSIGGDGFGLAYATNGDGNGYAVLVHPGDYHGVFFKQLIAGESDNTIATVELPATLPVDAPLVLHVQRTSGSVNVTVSGAALGRAPISLVGDEVAGSAATGQLGLLLSRTPDGNPEGAIFSDFAASSATCSGTSRDGGDAGAQPDTGIRDTGTADRSHDAGKGDTERADAVSMSFSCGSATPPPSSVVVGGVTYQLTWNDEFNGASLDTSKWNVSDGGWCCGVGPNLPENVYMNSGCLELRADTTDGGTGYSSGWVDTLSKFQWTRGYVEIRARLPKGQGMWPGLWLDELTSNPFAEFDILEELGNVPTTIYETNHLWPQGSSDGTQVHQCVFSGPDFSADFHVFGFQMQENQVTWYVDGVQTCVDTAGINTNEVYLMMNTAVGGVGSWPGAPNGTTVFPNYMDIDYARIYE